ncbi:hypothetical protein VTN96DRAFT_1832 [Rasamsonia emersonii]
MKGSGTRSSPLLASEKFHDIHMVIRVGLVFGRFPPPIPKVWICSQVEEEPDRCHASMQRSQHQRRNPVGTPDVKINLLSSVSVVGDDCYDTVMPLLGRSVKRRHHRAIRRVERSVVLEEKVDHVLVAVLGSPVQGCDSSAVASCSANSYVAQEKQNRFAASVLSGQIEGRMALHISTQGIDTTGNQLLHFCHGSPLRGLPEQPQTLRLVEPESTQHCIVAVVSSEVLRRLSVDVDRISFGALLEEQVENGDIAMLCSFRNSRSPALAGRIRIGVVVKKDFDNCGLSPENSHGEGRPSVAILAVDNGILAEQKPQCLLVALFSDVMQGRAADVIHQTVDVASRLDDCLQLVDVAIFGGLMPIPRDQSWSRLTVEGGGGRLRRMNFAWREQAGLETTCSHAGHLLRELGRQSDHLQSAKRASWDAATVCHAIRRRGGCPCGLVA